MATQNRGSKSPRGAARPGGQGAGGARSSGSGSAGSGRAGGNGAGSGRGPAIEGREAPRRLGAQQSNAPRRLGQQPARRPQSAGAQRRNQRRQKASARRWGWLSVAVVVAIIATFVGVKLSSSNSSGNGSTGADRTPSRAPASIVNQLTSTPLSLQSAQGTGGQSTSPYVTVANPTAIATGSKPRIAFIGAEFCPYCAVERYALILALSRIGTFHNLGVTYSGTTDGDIPTFSFLGSSYTSKYVTFTPYEEEDRNHQLLEKPPANIAKIWHAEEYPLLSAQGSVADEAWPWVDFNGKYVMTSFPTSLDTTLSNLEGSNGQGVGLSRANIVDGIRNPTSAAGQTINGSGVLVEANFIDAAICKIDGGAPASVCAMPGIKAAMAIISKQKPVHQPTSLPKSAPAALNQVN